MGPGPRPVQGRSRTRAARRAWRMDQPGATQVALATPPDYTRHSAAAGMTPAPVAYPTNGRLGDLMPSVYCTGCGEANPEGARFCAQCGTPLVRIQGERVADTTSTISLAGSDLDEAGEETGADSAAVAALPPGTEVPEWHPLADFLPAVAVPEDHTTQQEQEEGMFGSNRRARARAARAAQGEVARLMGEVAQLNHQLGLDRPWPERYLTWLWHALHGNLGTSFVYREPVRDLIASRFSVSAELVVLAMILGLASLLLWLIWRP